MDTVCVESIYARRGVYFSGLNAKFRRESAAGENFGFHRQLVPAICAKLASKSGALFRMQFWSESQPPKNFPESLFCSLGDGWLFSLHFAVSLSAKETFYRDFCLEFSSFL